MNSHHGSEIPDYLIIAIYSDLQSFVLQLIDVKDKYNRLFEPKLIDS